MSGDTGEYSLLVKLSESFVTLLSDNGAKMCPKRQSPAYLS